MSLPPLSDDAVVLGASAPSWRDALRLAGGALVASGAATDEYTDAMIAMVEEHGPYIVISPGLAFAHARPGASVVRDGLSVVTLANRSRSGTRTTTPSASCSGSRSRGSARTSSPSARSPTCSTTPR